MADERQKVADGEKLICFVLFLMLQQPLLREPIQIVTIVVIGYLIVEWTYPNGKKPAYLSPSHPLQIPHISMSYIGRCGCFVMCTIMHFD